MLLCLCIHIHLHECTQMLRNKNLTHRLANTRPESNEFKCTGHEFLTANTADKPARAWIKSEGPLQWGCWRNSQYRAPHSPTAKREIPLSATALAAASTWSSDGPFVISTAIWTAVRHQKLIFAKPLNVKNDILPLKYTVACINGL